MNVHVEFLGFPTVSDIIGRKKIEVTLSGNALKDVIDALITRYGPKVRKAFYDEKGTLDATLQVTLNGKVLTLSEQPTAVLKEGDTLTFMLLLAGG